MDTRDPPLPFPFDRPWSFAEAAQIACLLEASAPKAGNVHPTASFADMTFAHFVGSAAALGQTMSAWECQPQQSQSVGKSILEMVKANERRVGRNTNLGTLLLFGPVVRGCSTLVASSPTTTHLTPEILRTAIREVLAHLTPDDSADVYQAINLAAPGGMGKREQDDLVDTPPPDLLSAMAQVADWDAVARQFTNGYADVFEVLLPWLHEELSGASEPVEAICRLQIRWLAEEPDGLIRRKAGVELAEQVQTMAGRVERQLREAVDISVLQFEPYRNLDEFLRSQGNRLNPGTTADLIATTLFVQLLSAEA